MLLQANALRQCLHGCLRDREGIRVSVYFTNGILDAQTAQDSIHQITSLDSMSPLRYSITINTINGKSIKNQLKIN